MRTNQAQMWEHNFALMPLERRDLMTMVYSTNAMSLSGLEDYTVQAPISVSDSAAVAFALAGDEGEDTKDTIAVWDLATALGPKIFPGEFHATSLSFGKSGSLVAVGTAPQYGTLTVARFFDSGSDTPKRDVLFDNELPYQTVISAGWAVTPGQYRISIRWRDEGWIAKDSINAQNLVLKSSTSSIAMSLVAIIDEWNPGGNAPTLVATYAATIPVLPNGYVDATYAVVPGSKPVRDIAGNTLGGSAMAGVHGYVPTWNAPVITAISRPKPTLSIIGIPVYVGSPWDAMATPYDSVVALGDRLTDDEDQPTVRVIATATTGSQYIIDVPDSLVPDTQNINIITGGSVWTNKQTGNDTEPTLLISAAALTDGATELPPPQELLAGDSSNGWMPSSITPDGTTALVPGSERGPFVSYGGGQKRRVAPVRSDLGEFGTDNSIVWYFGIGSMTLTDHAADNQHRVLFINQINTDYRVFIARLSAIKEQREDGDGASAGVPQLVMSNGDRPAGAARPISYFLAGAVSKQDHLAVVAQLADGTKTIVRAKAVGQRPVLVIPGIFGSLPAAKSDFVDFLTQFGMAPSKLALDPLQNTYDDLVMSLRQHGYTLDTNPSDGYSLNTDLYTVGYDWRLPVVPQAEDGKVDPLKTNLAFYRNFDGVIEGLTAASLIDTKYEYGVDYLGHYLALAATNFKARYGVPLDSVDVIAHSTGGLIARAYVQSTAYGTSAGSLKLPKINELTMIATPHLGASKAWNVGHDNYVSDTAYRVILSKMAWYAYRRVMGDGIRTPTPIERPDGVVISREVVMKLAQTSPRYRNDHFSNVESVKLESAFLDLYCPCARALNPTYGFLSTPVGDDPILASGGWTINGDPYLRNEFLLDLNDGFNLDTFSVTFAAPFAKLVHATMIYGSERDADVFGGYYDVPNTISRAARRVGDAGANGGGSDDIVTMGALLWSREPLPDEVWYYEAEPLEPGDQTVPERSAIGLFDNGSNVVVYGFHNEPDSALRPTDHGGLNSNVGSQNLILKLLGMPVDADRISWGLHGAPLWGLADEDLLTDGMTLIWESQLPVAVDNFGNRSGVTDAGVVNDIPNARVLGFDSGSMSIPVDPTHLRITTIRGGSKNMSVSAWRVGTNLRMNVRDLGNGFEEITFAPVTVETRALPSGVASPVLGKDNSSLITAASREGSLLAFEHVGPTAAWTATELILQPGELLQGDPIAWIHPTSLKSYIAVVTTEGLVVFTRGSASWDRATLPSWMATQAQAADGVPSTVDLDGDLALILGRDTTIQTQLVAVGDAGSTILLYTLGDNGSDWLVENLTVDHLLAQGLSPPVFISRIATYVTSWDGRNIAGIDESGSVYSLWWTPDLKTPISDGRPLWTTSNLSALTNAPKMQGDITAFTTSWDATNIVGQLADGSVVTTWWVKSIDIWQTSNLSQDLGAPTLRANTLASYLTSWGAQNIAGINEQGETIVYWWTPAINEWRVDSLTQAATGDAVRGTFHLRGTGSLSLKDYAPSLALTGISDEGHVTQLFWMEASRWVMTDVTDASLAPL